MNRSPGARLRQVFEEAVADGTISREQAEALRARIGAALPPALRNRWRGLGPVRAELARTMAERLQMSPAQLREQLASGQSLSDLAATRGISRDQLLRMTERVVDVALDRAVAGGVLPASQRGRVRAWLLPHAEQFLDRRRAVIRVL